MLEGPQQRLLHDLLGLVRVEQAAYGEPLQAGRGLAQRVVEVDDLVAGVRQRGHEREGRAAGLELARARLTGDGSRKPRDG